MSYFNSVKKALKGTCEAAIIFVATGRTAGKLEKKLPVGNPKAELQQAE